MQGVAKLCWFERELEEANGKSRFERRVGR